MGPVLGFSGRLMVELLAARDSKLACVRHERLQMDPIPHSRSVTSIYLYIILSVR